jgi:hypothetical protein
MARLTALAPSAVLLLVAGASARDIPSNVQDLYNSITAQGKCNDIAATGFYSNEGDSGGNFDSPLPPPSFPLVSFFLTVIFITLPCFLKKKSTK